MKANILIHQKNLVAYLSDPYKEDCLAYFFKQHNFMSEETAKVSLKQIRNTVNLLLEVANGNHQRDFDEIAIVSKDNLEILRVKDEYRRFHLGYGRMEIPIYLDLSLMRDLEAAGLVKINNVSI